MAIVNEHLVAIGAPGPNTPIVLSDRAPRHPQCTLGAKRMGHVLIGAINGQLARDGGLKETTTTGAMNHSAGKPKETRGHLRHLLRGDCF